jgi:hypothetical protein
MPVAVCPQLRAFHGVPAYQHVEEVVRWPLASGLLKAMPLRLY